MATIPPSLWRQRGFASRLERLARILGTGFLFSLFALGAGVLAIIVLPLVSRVQRGDEPPDLAAQRLIHRSFKFFVRLGTIIRIWEVRCSGLERLREGPSLIIANHPTLMDVADSNFWRGIRPEAR
jgi:hypothetical protein